MRDLYESFTSIAAALDALTMPDDIASAGFLSLGNGFKFPTVIRIRRRGGKGEGFLCIYQSHRPFTNWHCFQTIEELFAIVAPDPEEEPTFTLAAASIMYQFRAKIG